MPTQEVKLLVGIPASGKSTWAQQEADFLESEKKTTAIISRDYVRQQLLGITGDEDIDKKTYFSKEREVFNEFVRQVNEAMELGIDVVFVDATHISPQSRRKTLSRLRPDYSTSLVLEVFTTPPEVCADRNETRTGFAKVPKDAIWDMYYHFDVPRKYEFPSDLYGFRRLIIKQRNGGDAI